jgi:hypothetical protein
MPPGVAESKSVLAWSRVLHRSRMSPDEQRKLDEDIRRFKRFQRRVFLRPLLANFLLWYEPARKPTPKGLFEYLRQFEKTQPVHAD